MSDDTLVGKPLPALNVTDWYPEPLSAADLAGHIAVIDFWATWCAPCMGAIPKNNLLQEKYAADGLMVIGICATTGSETMAQVAEEAHMQYPTAKDVDKTMEKALGVQYFPSYFIVDREGIVRAAGLSHSKVEPALEGLLAEK